MFERCEICGHKKALVYYHETKTFKCFGANGNVGGSIIDYIKAVEKTDIKKTLFIITKQRLLTVSVRVVMLAVVLLTT